MNETRVADRIEASILREKTFVVTLGTPLNHWTIKTITVKALTRFGAYWAAVSAEPELYVEKIKELG